MIDWTYNPEDYGKQALIPEGLYRVRIEGVKEKISRSGNEMIELTLKVSGQRSKMWYYIVFDKSDPEKMRMTNDKLGQIFDSFEIQSGDLDTEHWIGKVGAAKIRHRLNNDDMRAEIHYFIKRENQGTIPAWQEHPGVNPEMANFEEDNIPF